MWINALCVVHFYIYFVMVCREHTIMTQVFAINIAIIMKIQFF